MMINSILAARDEARLTRVAVKVQYAAPKYDRWQPQHFSSVAQEILHEIDLGKIGQYMSTTQPEIVALRLLDFLSSKQGYIRRKGLSFRTVSFYRFALPKLVQQVRCGLPIELNSLCLCTTLANMRYAGESPYPHMGAFIAFENLHKIILGSRAIYQPGVRMTLGYEGTLFEPLYFQAKGVVQQSLQILRRLNNLAAHNFWPNGENPIKIVDALWMIERSFGSVERFTKRVEDLAPVLPEDESSLAWREWYNQTVSDYFFSSKVEREQFVEERARWRRAILYLKYNEGISGHGFMDYGTNAMTFTPSGRRQNMLALQLIPENSHLPHQRVITYNPAADKWRTVAFKAIVDDDSVYAPRYVAQYSYPFYYERIASSANA